MSPVGARHLIAGSALKLTAIAVVIGALVVTSALLITRTWLPLTLIAALCGIPAGFVCWWLARDWLRASRDPAPAVTHTTPTRAGVRAMALPIVCVALASAALLGESMFLGRGLVNAGPLLHLPPWSRDPRAEAVNWKLVDQTLVMAPESERMHREFLAGRFSLWNPNLACGVPAIGSMQSALLHPLNLLSFPISPFSSSGWLAFIKLTLAGAFTALLLRRWSGTWESAAAGGVVFALGGYNVFWLNHPQVNCVLWLPLLLWFVDQRVAAKQTPFRFGAWVVGAIGVAGVLLGGHPPSMVHVALAVAAFWVARSLPSRRGGARMFSDAFYISSAVALGVSLAAPHLLAYLEYNRLSSTADASALVRRASDAFSPAALAHYFMPYFTGAPMLNGPDLSAYFGVADATAGKTVYVGVIPLLLSPLALTHVTTRRKAIACVAVIVMVWLVVLGVRPIPSILGALPVLRDINHTRAVIFATLAFALLAGLGLTAIPAILASPRRHVLSFLSITLGVVFLAALRWKGGDLWSIDDEKTSGARAFLSRQAIVFALSVLIFALVVSLPVRLGLRWRGIVLVAAITAELVWHGYGFNPAIKRDSYFPTTPAIDLLRQSTGVGGQRVMALGNLFTPDSPSAYGLRDVRGVDYVTVKRFEQFVTGRSGDFFFRSSVAELDRFSLIPAVGLIVTDKRQQLDPEFFDRIYSGEVLVYRYREALPRALVVFNSMFVPDDIESLRLVRNPDFDPARVAILSEQSEEPIQLAPRGTTPAQAVTWLRDDPDAIELRVKADQPGVLVVFDTHFPGWVAEVNGQRTPVLRADYTFRGIRVSTGESTVRLQYRPVPFTVGLAICAAAATFLSCATVARRKERITS